MATAFGASSVLQTTPEKENFQLVTRLLIAGGTRILREVFDSIHPPPRLPTVLADPQVIARLEEAKLKQPQWDCLYPDTDRYGKSSEFDISLLVCLLRHIGNLPSPPLGWDELPDSAEKTVSADLARVKFFRNTVYAHVTTMEISDDDFDDLWPMISGALVRLARYISRPKRQEWTKAIQKLRNARLTSEDERHVEELKKWYISDYEIKEIVERGNQMLIQLKMEQEKHFEKLCRIEGVL